MTNKMAHTDDSVEVCDMSVGPAVKITLTMSLTIMQHACSYNTRK